jgi:hypothetical protein
MDDIQELETNIIHFKLASLRLALTIANLEDQMVKEVEMEHKLEKGNPLLANDKLRAIAVRERLIMNEEYSEALAEKYASDEAIMYGEARLRGMKREFIMKYCQNAMPV